MDWQCFEALPRLSPNDRWRLAQVPCDLAQDKGGLVDRVKLDAGADINEFISRASCPAGECSELQ